MSAVSTALRPAALTRRLATPATALVVACIELLLIAASFPLAALTHQLSFSNSAAGTVAELSFTLVGAFVAYRRPAQPIGWLILGVGGLLALSVVGGAYAVLDYRMHGGRLVLGWLALLVQPAWLPAFVLLALAIILFPDGHLPTGWWRWPVRALVALVAAWQVASAALVVDVVLSGSVRVEAGSDLYQFDHPTGPWVVVKGLTGLLFAALALSFAAWLIGQRARYRRLAGERRVQQKWILSGAIVAALAVFTNLLPYPFSSTGNELTIADFATVGLAALPIAMGVGILKYRLYEIDRLVSRTLAYAVLTALLAGTFVGLVALTTDVLPFSSTVGVAASTLAAAALFNPLRGRVQHAIDRRFNRARYDAEATVAAFTARLRDSVDLDAVQSELLVTVQRAVEPAHASLWIVGGAR